jgi:hypothetical protein
MGRLSANVLRYGKEGPLPQRRELRAGPLSLVYEEGGIRYVRLGGREVVRRVYVAVRDPAWGTVPHRIGDLRIAQEPDSFCIGFTCENVEGAIAFAWRGTVSGEPDGTVTFAMDGWARSAFRTSRTGLCVLHPIAECAGRPCSVEHTDGTVEDGRFPLLISPHQPFMDLRAISHEVAPGVRTEVRFEGDTFEMEDQRNWTDASYKTYSRPLALTRPYELHAGERVRQTVRIRLSGSPPLPVGESEAPAVSVCVGAPGPLPRIGFCGGTGRQRARAAALRPGHLRVQLRLGEPDWQVALMEAAEGACPLEVALIPGDGAEDELRALRAALDGTRPNVVAWFVLAGGPPTLAAVRRIVDDYGRPALVGGGSAGGFVELNRSRPERSALDAVTYAMNPQVHQFDNASMVEALDGQAWTIRTAREFLGDVPLAVGPITLGRAPDERQASLFCAAWTVGSLRRVCEGSAWSATYYETAGPGGLMASGDGPVFPVYHVFADVAEFAGGESLALGVSHPLLADGLALRKGARTCALLANMTNELQAVTLSGVRGRALVRTMDETNAERAMFEPQGFRAERGRPLVGDLVELPPYAVARVDWGEDA